MSVRNSNSSEVPTQPKPLQAGSKALALGLPAGAGSNRRLLSLLILLLVLFTALLALFLRYIISPAPLPDLVPAPVNLNYPPHYVFSIYNVNQPVSVAPAPGGERLYVAESGGDRLVKIFDREGIQLGAFAPPLTNTPERSPVYLATSSDGRIFVSDRAQHAVFVFDADGNYLDTILSPSLTLSEYLSKHLDGLSGGTQFAYNVYQDNVAYMLPGEAAASLPAPDLYDWSPLGLRIDSRDRLLLTDITEDQFQVYIFPAEVVQARDWTDFDAQPFAFGETGKEAGQLDYPNNAIVDSQGRIYVVDGNNSRISVWDSQGNFLFNFGRGSGDGVINLPRGVMVDDKDRLYVVDAVDHRVKVYDVSKEEIAYLFSFGDFGVDDGLFNYPNDIAVDRSGRVYVADRENNRIQVWLY